MESIKENDRKTFVINSGFMYPTERGLLLKICILLYTESTKIPMCTVMIRDLYTVRGLHHEIKEGNLTCI